MWKRPARPAMIAPSLRELASWAPVIPVVLRATSPRSRSGASGLFLAWLRRIASRPARSGGETRTRRSKRPGRSSARSSFSTWLEAAITITIPGSFSNPSSSTRSWFSACSRSLVPPSPPPELREPPIASSSSMKMTARPDLRASLKRRRMRAAPRPTNISTKPEPEAAKKSTPAWAATARASIVLPVPGGPWRRTPRGGFAPRAPKRSGSRSQAATSISSSLAASTPWTSSQRTGSVRDAFTVSGFVDPIIPRIIFRKTKQRIDMNRTPKTGYQLKKNSCTFAAIHAVWRHTGNFPIAHPSKWREKAKGRAWSRSPKPQKWLLRNRFCGLALALDLGAADDGVLAGVAEDDPRLVAAVVVRRPQLQGRRAAPDRDLLLAGRVEAAPDPHEGVPLPLGGDRRRLFVAGMDGRVRRQLQQPHHRGLEVGEAAGAGGHRPAHRAFEEDIGSEDDGAVDEVGEVAGGVAGSEDGFDLEPAGFELLAVAEDDLNLVFELGGAGLVGDQWRVAELRPRLGETGDVVAVRVGDENVGDLDPVALGALEQRRQFVVAVDEDAGAAAGVGDQVGVRQPHRVLGPLDDHSSSSYPRIRGV